MAENLITANELAVWSGVSESVVEGDDLAVDVMRRMSSYARFLGFYPLPEAEWGWQTREETPFDVKLVVLKVARRSYTNPGEVVQEGSIGPIGGDRLRDEAAMSLELTETERATLTKYNLAGDPEIGDSGTLWVQPTNGGTETLLQTSPLYVGDDQQINLEDSADPREWKIPLFNPGDPGDDSLYPDDEV
jgi:hypothetical protein